MGRGIEGRVQKGGEKEKGEEEKGGGGRWWAGPERETGSLRTPTEPIAQTNHQPQTNFQPHLLVGVLERAPAAVVLHKQRERGAPEGARPILLRHVPAVGGWVVDMLVGRVAGLAGSCGANRPPLLPPSPPPPQAKKLIGPD
jgi:hypothetical protein